MSNKNEPQNFNNHGKLVPMFHFVGLPLLLITIIGSIVNLFAASSENLFSAILICSLCILMFIALASLRTSSLKAQDRAIRAEERLRYFIKTGKDLPSDLKLSQIIALRFASDEEYEALLEKTLTEKLKSKEIKQAIKNWKADNNRV